MMKLTRNGCIFIPNCQKQVLSHISVPISLLTFTLKDVASCFYFLIWFNFRTCAVFSPSLYYDNIFLCAEKIYVIPLATIPFNPDSELRLLGFLQLFFHTFFHIFV